MTLALERVPNESKRGAKAEVPHLGFGGYQNPYRLGGVPNASELGTQSQWLRG